MGGGLPGLLAVVPLCFCAFTRTTKNVGVPGGVGATGPLSEDTVHGCNAGELQQLTFSGSVEGR
ncbi:hypothetical protein HispidOSU_023311 [Sigmodon hispidus]